MPICNKCFVDKPDNGFYKVNNKGVITLRRICKECHIQREIRRYANKVGKKTKFRISFCTTCNQWKDKVSNFAFQIDKCNSCIKNDLEAIVEPEEKITIELSPEPQSPEITHLESKIEPLYRTCKTCGMEKLNIEFYKKNKTNCISCLLINRKKLNLEQNDGTQWFVYSAPGVYQCKEQFDALSNLMTSIGWKYELNGTDELSGTWYKDGIKDVNKQWDKVILDETKPTFRKKRAISSKLGVSKLDGKYPEILALREKGYIYKEIAELLGCSHTLLRTFVKKSKRNG
jgi:hypothetical protein